MTDVAAQRARIARMQQQLREADDPESAQRARIAQMQQQLQDDPHPDRPGWLPDKDDGGVLSTVEGWAHDANDFIAPIQKATEQAVGKGVTGLGIALEELLLGAADEPAAAVGAGVDWLLSGGKAKISDRYSQRLGNMRAEADDFAKENPNTTAALQALGAFVPALFTFGVGAGPAVVKQGASRIARRGFSAKAPAVALGTPLATVAPALRRPRLLYRAARTAGVGSALGAAHGFGTARGGVDERMDSAELGGMFGGAIGGATPVVGSLVRPMLGRWARNRTANRTGAPPEVVDRIQSIFEKGHGSYDDFDAVAKYLKGRGTAQSLNVDLDPGLLAAAGKSLVRLHRAGGDVTSAINRRSEMAADSFDGAMDEVLGDPAAIATTAAKLSEKNRALLQGAYARAYSRKIDYETPDGQELFELFATGRVSNDLMAAGQKMARHAGDSSAQIVEVVGRTKKGKVKKKKVRVPNTRMADYIKRAIDDQVEAEKHPVTGKLSAQGVALSKLRDDMMTPLRRLVPELQEAADLAKPDLVRLQMMEFGEGILKPSVTRGEVLQTLREQQQKNPKIYETVVLPAVKQGLRNAIVKLGSNAATPPIGEVSRTGWSARAAIRDARMFKTVRDLSTEGHQGKIEAVIGEKAARQLFAARSETAEAMSTSESLRSRLLESMDEKGRTDLAMEAAFTSGTNSLVNVGRRFRKNRKDKKATQAPEPSDADFINYLMHPAQRDDLIRIARTRHPSERGLVGAKLVEQNLAAGLFAGGNAREHWEASP